MKIFWSIVFAVSQKANVGGAPLKSATPKSRRRKCWCQRYKKRKTEKKKRKRSSITFIPTCSFKWNHLMVLYAYHYHPNGSSAFVCSVPVPLPFRAAVHVQRARATHNDKAHNITVDSTSRTTRCHWVHESTNPRVVDSIKFRSVEHFYLADVWLAVSTKCCRPVIVLTRIFTKHTHTHTTTATTHIPSPSIHTSSLLNA